MTPKEKAEELVYKMGEEIPLTASPSAVQCALIVVDEMLSLGSLVGSDLSDTFYIYWKDVKQEIEQLTNSNHGE